MSIKLMKHICPQSSLRISLIQADCNWPSKEALGQAAQLRSVEEIAAINSDFELFSRRRLKSCRLVKLLRDAWDADWELQNTRPEPLKAAC